MKKILRRLLYVLAVVTTGVSVKAALDYRYALSELEEEGTDTIRVPRDVMQKLDEGLALVHWVDNHGEKHYVTTENSLIKNL